VSYIWLYTPLNGQCLEGVDTMNRDQVMDHFLNGLRDFHAYFHKVYIHGVFWP